MAARPFIIYPGAGAAGIPAAVPAPQPIVKKSLSKWAIRGLDLSDAGFSKLHSNESKLSSDKTQYNLEPEKFESFKNTLIQKVNRMHALTCMAADDDMATACEVLKEYTRISRESITLARDERWPDTDPIFALQEDADDYTDEQLKVSTIGSYIHSSLTEDAQKQLKAESDFFEVKDADGNQYFDGASYFYTVADLVDPDNGQMIEKVREQLRSLDVKNFGYSVIKMLAEFNNLMTRIRELGGTYDDDDQFLDFWECLKSMKEKEFARYVKTEKDLYRKRTRANHGRIEAYMRDMNDKEVAMKTDNEWNIMSPEDAMVMALVNVLETKTKKEKSNLSKSNQKSDKPNENKPALSDEEKFKRKDAKIPDWKKVQPKEGDSKTKVVDEKTYYWCTKCRNGQGMWAMHKEHSTDFKYGQSKKTNDNKETKKVTFAAEKVSEEDSTDNTEPAIQVNKSLLMNAKAYLAQFQDFPEGGSEN